MSGFGFRMYRIIAPAWSTGVDIHVTDIKANSKRAALFAARRLLRDQGRFGPGGFNPNGVRAE